MQNSLLLYWCILYTHNGSPLVSLVASTAKPLILQFVLRYARNHLPTM